MSKQKMTTRQYLVAATRFSKRAFKMSPVSSLIRVVDSIIQATLPIVTTYFAALTTTALTDAYAGDETAADRALIYVIITAVLGMLSVIWGSVTSYIIDKTRYKINAAIEDEMIDKFSNLPFANYDDKQVADLHEKARRFSDYFSYIFENVSSMLAYTFGAIGSIIALVYVSPWLSLIVVIAATPSILIRLRLTREQLRHWETNITRRRRRWTINANLHRSKFIADFRVYGSIKYLIELHAKLRDADDKQRLEIELKSTWKRLAAEIGEMTVQLGSLIWVTLQIIAQSQPVGQFLYVQQMVSRVFDQMGALAAQLGRLDEELAQMVDYQLFMEMGTALAGDVKLRKVPEEISVNNVSFSYPKTEKTVLTDVSIKIRSGEKVAIVGENGAGKSTLLKIIMGLYVPTEGEVAVDSINLVDIDITSWHRYISLLLQDFAIYEFATIKENITLGDIDKDYSQEDVEAAISSAEFTDVVDGLEYGVDTYVDRWMAHENKEATATELSGGQKQRLAMARNFYRDSPIVVFDEPTSAIDALAESKIFKRLFNKKDKTIIIVSHRLTTVEKADRIYMMKDGRVVEMGTHQELVQARGEYYRMFESQLHPTSV